MSDAKKRLQDLAAQAAEIIAEMTQIAHENQIVSIPFLGGSLQFGVDFEGGHRFYEADTVSALCGYYPAKGGALMTDGYEWRSSHFECWPSQHERTWLFGDDKNSWPKTDYEIE